MSFCKLDKGGYPVNLQSAFLSLINKRSFEPFMCLHLLSRLFGAAGGLPRT